MTREELVAHITTELTTLFPTNGVKVYEQSILGEKNIYIRYMHFASAKECSNGIAENDPAFMRLAIYPERGTYVIDRPTTHFSRLIGKDGAIAWRKLRGNTEQEVAEKLLAWFRKNQTIILSAPTLHSL
jgi:hypothetical protein